MTTSELKLQILKQIDSLEKPMLQELYGLITNYLNEQRDADDWGQMTEEQQQGLMDAISQLQEGKGIPHEQVIEKYRKKYSNA